MKEVIKEMHDLKSWPYNKLFIKFCLLGLYKEMSDLGPIFLCSELALGK